MYHPLKGITDFTFNNSKINSDFPICWEFVFIQDDSGLAFAGKMIECLNELSKEDVKVISFSGQPSDLTCTVNCAFKRPETLKNLLEHTLDEAGFYDERTKSILTARQLKNQIDKLVQSTMKKA